MARVFSAFRACIFCSQPFRPENRKKSYEFYVCKSPECQAKLKLYKRLVKSRAALFEFIRKLELKG